MVAWERRLMVVGDAPESIQYPLRAARRGRAEGVTCPAPSLLLLGTLTKIRFVLDEDSYLVPELDGVRIFSRSTHEFLHEVPGEVLTRAPRDPGHRLLSTTAALGQCSRAGSGH